MSFMIEKRENFSEPVLKFNNSVDSKKCTLFGTLSNHARAIARDEGFALCFILSVAPFLNRTYNRVKTPGYQYAVPNGTLIYRRDVSSIQRKLLK